MRGRSILASMLVTALSAAVALPARAQAPAAAGPQVTVLLAQRIDTMDPARPRAEAMAFDATGTILALGGRDELLAKYPGALLLVRGTKDFIPPHEREFLAIAPGHPAEAVLIGGASHIFDVFDPANGHATRAVEATVAWFERTL